MVDIIKQDMTDIWAVAGDVVAPDSAKVRAGWGVEAVPRQWWNWFENRQDTNIAYMLQKGIPEWDALTEYLTNKSYVQRNNVVYKCILTGVNKDPQTNPLNWVKAFPESSAYLETIRPLAVSNNSIAYIDGTGTAQNTPTTAFGRSILNVADAAAARALEGSQQANSNLTALSGVTAATNALPYFTGSATMGTTTLTSAGRDIIAGADSTAIRAVLGLGNAATLNIGTTSGTIAAGDDSRITNAVQKYNNLGDLVNFATARSNLGLGTAAVATVTTTSTDTSTGRLLKVGDFGLGGSSTLSAPIVTDANSATVNGIYKLASPFSNAPVATFHTIVVTTYDNDVDQMAFTAGVSNPRTYTRRRQGGIWSQWYENYTPAILSANVQSILAAANYAAIRSLLSLSNKAEAGANSDITALNGLTTTLTVAQGGTGTTTATGTGSVVRSDSPSFTGTPSAPTAALNDNTTKLATTAYVQANSITKPALIGTVSQSGGIPTGAVFERGNNSNGEYVRFADGTQICTFPTGGIGAGTPQGNAWTSGASTWTFPAAFASGSTVTVTGMVDNGGATFVGLNSAPSSTGVVWFRISLYSDATARGSRLMAVGRWF